MTIKIADLIQSQDHWAKDAWARPSTSSSPVSYCVLGAIFKIFKDLETISPSLANEFSLNAEEIGEQLVREKISVMCVSHLIYFNDNCSWEDIKIVIDAIDAEIEKKFGEDFRKCLTATGIAQS